MSYMKRTIKEEPMNRFALHCESLTWVIETEHSWDEMDEIQDDVIFNSPSVDGYTVPSHAFVFVSISEPTRDPYGVLAEFIGRTTKPTEVIERSEV